MCSGSSSAMFHGLFFNGNTWLFAYSDTLIRLFPIRFWEDTFLTSAFIVLAGGAGIGVRVEEREDAWLPIREWPDQSRSANA